MRSRLGIVLPFVVAFVLALSGCGDDPSEDVDSEPSGQASIGETSSAPPSVEPSDDVPSSPTSTVEPAAGNLMKLSNVSANAPKGFTVDPPDMSYLRFAFERNGVQSISLANTPSVNEELSLGKQAEISIRNHIYSTAPQIEKPVEIGGVKMYHFAGQVNDSEYVEEYGAIYDGSQVSINFLLSADATDAERTELVESVMASMVFT